MLAKLSELNRKYIQNNGFGAGKEAFVFTNRGSKLVLSAPHAVKTQLNGRVKAADLFTGALAELVGEDRGISTLIRTAYLEREYLADEFVKERGLSGYFFLDLHGMVDHEKFELAAGTGLLEADAYAKALKAVEKLGKSYGLRMALNHPHYSGIAGMKAFTARMQIQTGKPQVLQLEIGRAYRDFYERPENVTAKTLPFLAELSETLENCL